MSAILFAAIAIGWAVYLLPKALRRDEDVALSRPVEEFSDSMRVLGRGAARPAAPAAVADLSADGQPVSVTESVEAAESAAPRPTPRVSREAARRAAQRRRRVLALLLSVLVIVTTTSILGYTPWFTITGPVGLIGAFLVIARLTVRAQQVRRAAPVQQIETIADLAPTAVPPAVEIEPDLDTEDTIGLSRSQLVEAVAAPVLEDGGLWDPLPVTLPTYVGKARARRTVRTIELSQMTSSGHDAADTALAREAAEQAAERAAAEVEDSGLGEAEAAGA